MQQSIRIMSLLAVGFLAASLIGCTGRPAAVEVPPIQPDKVAQGALTSFDTDGDGQLSTQELAACPGILDAIGRYDKDNNKQISKEELVKRFSLWEAGGVAVTTLACNVTMDGRPLAGAQVELVPEKFLADVIQPATGTTDSSGSAILGIDKEYLPDDMKELQGLVHQGVFRVNITHSEVDIPTKYNTKSTLGMEVSADTGKNFVNWRLTSK